jgi:hypothetical protein
MDRLAFGVGDAHAMSNVQYLSGSAPDQFDAVIMHTLISHTV